jgi:hypothetical protein
LPKVKKNKSQWSEPVILVPIIVAIITAIVGPTYAYYYLQSQDSRSNNDGDSTNGFGKLVDPTQLSTKPEPNTTQLSTKPEPNTTQLSTKPEPNTTQLSTKPEPVPNMNIKMVTDKMMYGLKDYVRVSGTIVNPVEGTNLRLDIYDPEGSVFQPYNETFTIGAEGTPAYPRLSDIQLKPNNEGEFSYRFPLDNPVGGLFIKGNYSIIATSGSLTGNTTFTAR